GAKAPTNRNSSRPEWRGSRSPPNSLRVACAAASPCALAHTSTTSPTRSPRTASTDTRSTVYPLANADLLADPESVRVDARVEREEVVGRLPVPRRDDVERVAGLDRVVALRRLRRCGGRRRGRRRDRGPGRRQ